MRRPEAASARWCARQSRCQLSWKISPGQSVSNALATKMAKSRRKIAPSNARSFATLWAPGPLAEVALDQRPIARFKIARQLHPLGRVLAWAHRHQTADGAGVSLQCALGLTLDHGAAFADALGDAGFLDEDRLFQLGGDLGGKNFALPWGAPRDCPIAPA